VAITIALVASLETLLSIEAIDKIDPQKRLSPTNRELKAQGLGNMVSGLLGGLPVTSVIVRSSANVSAGGVSKLSAIAHGIWLLLSVLFIPGLLNLIPLSALAAILILTGYKLAKVSIFKEYYQKGWNQFIPFMVTVIAILLTDLLVGIFIGLLVGVFFVLRSNYKSAIVMVKDEHRYLIRFRKEVTFLHKVELKAILEKVTNDTAVLIDATKSEFIDNDIVELVNNFIVNAETRGIRIYIKYAGDNSRNYFNDIAKREIV
jgi:MFS superfamily sulfate permease-like transporter